MRKKVEFNIFLYKVNKQNAKICSLVSFKDADREISGICFPLSLHFFLCFAKLTVVIVRVALKGIDKRTKYEDSPSSAVSKPLLTMIQCLT